MVNKKYAFVPVVCLLLLPVLASGTIVNFNFPIDGPQANAGAGTGATGTGTGLVTLDTATNAMTWNVSWSGLTGAVTAAHFHGPALPIQNAGVQISLSGLVSPDVSNAVLSDLQESNLLSGLWYVNIHTNQYPGGEIRGQVVPEPLTLALLATGGALMIRKKRQVRL